MKPVEIIDHKKLVVSVDGVLQCLILSSRHLNHFPDVCRTFAHVSGRCSAGDNLTVPCCYIVSVDRSEP